MRNVHYFQRFSKKDDVATENTLLLLGRLQHYDVSILEHVIRGTWVTVQTGTMGDSPIDTV